MEIILGDITISKADAIINAANGYIGVMGAGVAKAIRNGGSIGGLKKKHGNYVKNTNLIFSKTCYNKSGKFMGVNNLP